MFACIASRTRIRNNFRAVTALEFGPIADRVFRPRMICTVSLG